MKKSWIAVLVLMGAGLAHAQPMGALQVNGQAGKFQIFQKVKAVRCAIEQRGVCDAPIFFGLNKAQAVPEGSYLVGFENSLYPERVRVDAGRTTNLNLDKVTIPAEVRGKRIRIYRDFSSVVEQKKILLEMFAMNRHFFRLDVANFGDLYLTGSWERDFVQRFTYETCSRIDTYGEAAAEAKSVCRAWNTAKSPMDLRELFDFDGEGSFQEKWVTYPGDVIPSKHPRYLVSAPMTDQDFVAVFPGVYKVQAEGKNTVAVSIVTSTLSGNGADQGF